VKNLPGVFNSLSKDNKIKIQKTPKKYKQPLLRQFLICNLTFMQADSRIL